MGKTRFAENGNNIIPMNFDADFFYNRALRYLERKDYTKALKYYWRTIDLEPEEPIHYCNIANILAEIGLYKESNEILFHVIDKIDCEMPDCYFFLGNNYLNLDDYEMGYTYIQRYLEISPDGEFNEEADEILSYISLEGNGCSDFNFNNDNKEKFILHSYAKNLLDKGKFNEAQKKLEKIVKEYPNYLVARNNLGLAYFYLEEYEKAIQQIKSILDKDISNIHALCNLTIFYKHLEEKKEYNNLLSTLYKLYPYQKDQTYKLATTFAILEKHEMVFRHLSKIVDRGEAFDPTFLHYCGVAAYNTGRYDYAKKCWEQIYKNDSFSMIAKYYLEIILEMDNSEKALILPSFFYQYKLPIEELIDLLHRNNKKNKNKLVFASLFWGLRNCDENLKGHIIFSLINFNNVAAEKILRDFLLHERVSCNLKKKAIIALDEINAKPPYNVYLNGKIIMMDRIIPELKLWKNEWIEVIKLIDKNYKDTYSIVELYDAKILWYQYIGSKYNDATLMRKAEGWTAAIEYIVNRTHKKPITYKELSEKYAVATATISRNVKELEKMLEINKRCSTLCMYKNS